MIFPPERDVDEIGSKSYVFDYSIDRAEELLSTVDPIIRENFPYDEWVHANWLQLTVFQLLSEYPRGSLQVWIACRLNTTRLTQAAKYKSRFKERKNFFGCGASDPAAEEE